MFACAAQAMQGRGGRLVGVGRLAGDGALSTGGMQSHGELRHGDSTRNDEYGARAAAEEGWWVRQGSAVYDDDEDAGGE